MLKKKFYIGNKLITISAIALVIFGSFMIASAEMGNDVGNINSLKEVMIKQILSALAGIIIYFLIMNISINFNIRINKIKTNIYWAIYWIIFGLLLACRLVGATNGAYAWLRFGSFSFQPSELAKTFMIIFAGKLLGVNHSDNRKIFFKYMYAALGYFFVIAFVQHDLGSAIVLAVICYCVLLIPNYSEVKKIQWNMIIIVFAVIGILLILLSPPITELLKKFSDHYMVGRFLASADPFLYRYDSGYHIIMALVSFANGNIFGLGYGNSIHKYMNFPNPSNDFILPVIVEELGIVGFSVVVIAYALILIPLVSYSLKTPYITCKIVLLGTFLYMITHFILNVGGVSGLIPLTGVPLLLLSSGGSSLMSFLSALAFSQAEIVLDKGNKK